MPSPWMRKLRALRPFRLSSITIFFVAVGFTFQSISTAHARNHQEAPYALIYGTVWSPENQPVYGVHVYIRRSTEKKVRWEALSDHSGEFAQRVPAGEADYILWADLKGSPLSKKYKLKAGPSVTVHVYNDEREDVGVHLTH